MNKKLFILAVAALWTAIGAFNTAAQEGTTVTATQEGTTENQTVTAPYLQETITQAVEAAIQKENPNNGYLTGSFENNSVLYNADQAVSGSANPDDKIGSNNYLKLDYYKGKISAGLQLEAYTPHVQDYPTELKGANLTNYYVSWTDESFSLTAGTFYEQFGSGLLFRSWEDRTLGLNNAVMGARFTYNYQNILGVKLIWGMPRLGMSFSDTQVRGADLHFSISDLAGWTNASLNLEGSLVNRYAAISVDLEEEGGSPNTTGYSARANFESGGFSAHVEYVDAGKKSYQNATLVDGKIFSQKKGNAQLVELGYNKGGLGINLTARRLEWMDTQISSSSSGTNNLMNYVPALCTQYTYLLTNFHPYTPETGKTNGYSGEMGAQLDAFFSPRIHGKRPLKLHANYSTYYTIDQEYTFKAGRMLYQDLSVDVEYKFNKQFKALLLWSLQEQNTTYGGSDDTRLQNIFVTDMTYKFNRSFSLRWELQYLVTFEDEGDWCAALVEANFAPRWSVWASDMYNHGSTNLHYYNAGLSYAQSRTRVALSYGRNKSGYLCSGGVCRVITAYTGLSLQITTSF